VRLCPLINATRGAPAQGPGTEALATGGQEPGHGGGFGRERPLPFFHAPSLEDRPVQRIEPLCLRTDRSSVRCRCLCCHLRFRNRPSSGCLPRGALPQGMHVPATVRADSASLISVLADYGKICKGVVKIYVTPFVAPDRLWRLETRIPQPGGQASAQSWLQIMRAAAAKADSQPIPPLSAPRETPDCPRTSNRRRAVRPPPLLRSNSRSATVPPRPPDQTFVYM
jgi:hypothetical protein